MFSRRLRWYTAMVPVLLAVLMAVHGATIKFDQSQTGDYNLQIHLKNIELYAVFDDSGGSDDEYGELPDYTDPTDAPSKPSSTALAVNSSSTSATTKAPLPSVTDATIFSTASTPSDPYSPSNSEKIVQMVEALIASNGNTSDLPTDPPAVVATPPPPSSSQSSSGAIATAFTSASSGTNNRNKCGPGYFRDPMGRCRRIRKPHLPFLQMVHTPGVIKSFQPQQRTTGDVSATSN